MLTPIGYILIARLGSLIQFFALFLKLFVYLKYNWHIMEIIVFEKLDSTNTYAKSNIENLDDKTIISADFQTNGRGRFERKWVDLGSENIYMTFVLKPSDKILNVYSNLTQYLSVVLCKQFEDMGLTPQIKWPNDVLLGGKKVCGILAEAVIKGGVLKGIVLGIGVNLNANQNDVSQIDRPATSLNLELGQNINKQEFMNKLIESFFKDYDEFLKQGFSMIKQDYERMASFLNQNIKVSVFNIIKTGYSKGIDDDGTLILLNDGGIIEKINMGEIVD